MQLGVQLACLIWISTQAALAAVKKEAAQLQLDGQQQRALSDADLQWEQQQTARAYIGLAADSPPS